MNYKTVERQENILLEQFEVQTLTWFKHRKLVEICAKTNDWPLEVVKTNKKILWRSTRKKYIVLSYGYFLN